MKTLRFVLFAVLLSLSSLAIAQPGALAQSGGKKSFDTLKTLGMLTLTDMRYLVALARARHFGRAATTCRVSQPTLSVAIKKVEERLGVLLFERNVQEIRITEVGQRLVDQAERVLAEALKLEELANQGKEVGGQAVLGRQL